MTGPFAVSSLEIDDHQRWLGNRPTCRVQRTWRFRGIILPSIVSLSRIPSLPFSICVSTIHLSFFSFFFRLSFEGRKGRILIRLINLCLEISKQFLQFAVAESQKEREREIFSIVAYQIVLTNSWIAGIRRLKLVVGRSINPIIGKMWRNNHSRLVSLCVLGELETWYSRSPSFIGRLT